MQILDEGYRLPLTEWPPSSYLPNNKSALQAENRELVSETLRSLEKSTAIKRVKKRPWLIIPLQVATSALGKTTAPIIFIEFPCVCEYFITSSTVSTASVSSTVQEKATIFPW